jgi:para-aminobenzoate synthetase/4-amino-4-deoxychorismate lyase
MAVQSPSTCSAETWSLWSGSLPKCGGVPSEAIHARVDERASERRVMIHAVIELPPGSVLIRDHLAEQPRWLAFRRPIATIETFQIQDVMECLQRVDAQITKGLYAAGFVSYEAAGAMDAAFHTHSASGFPLLWFGLYEHYDAIPLPQSDQARCELGTWRSSVSLRDYYASIAKIKEFIRLGDTYQVNYTFRLRTGFSGDPFALFLALYGAQRTSYAAYINLDRYHICSVSPELFFTARDGVLTCKPMKGTIARGNTTTEDAERGQQLHASAKSRAENVMIVDMIRNDMGTIAEAGSVHVEKLFSIEKYPTVFQMTSTVNARISVPLSQVFRHMFPCASITGAPKVKTMQIIKELEPDARGIYTGSIGYVTPDANSQFNVAIRTAVVDTATQSVEYGVGGGIVWDSDATDEYEECQTKASVLLQPYPDFDLIETLLWDPERGFYLLDSHLARLWDSANYFEFAASSHELNSALGEFAVYPRAGRQRVRIILSRSGEFVIESAPLASLCGATVGLATTPINKHSVFLYHKTTHRQMYTDLLDERRARERGLLDVLLWNDAGFVTETSMANVVIVDRGEFLTPALDQGLLPGVFRRHLLQQGVVKERNITVDELTHAQAVFLINSVRGWMYLEKSGAQNTWTIQRDACYETPNLVTMATDRSSAAVVGVDT